MPFVIAMGKSEACSLIVPVMVMRSFLTRDSIMRLVSIVAPPWVEVVIAACLLPVVGLVFEDALLKLKQ